MSVWRRPKGMEWLAALFLFLMLREWLLPLSELTDTGTLWPFYMIVAGVLLLDLVVPYRWLTFPFKLLGILWIIHSDFFTSSFLSTEWLYNMYASLVRDVPLAFQQDWISMSLISRNLLFDLMLAILISMVTYLVLEQRQGLWFVFLTELYLAVLDTFLPYEADGAIIRTLIYGFMLLAVAHLTAISKRAPIAGKKRWTLWNTLIAPVLILAIVVSVAYAGPKKDAVWPDPIAFLTGGEEGPVGTMKKVGYDNNDENLGGPFQQDEALVFVAITNERTYWRGDSKDIYTGRGWQKGEREYEPILNLQTHQWKQMLFHGTETKEVRATMDFSRGEPYFTMFYPGQLKKVVSIEPDNATMVYDRASQQVEVRAGRVDMRAPREEAEPEEGGVPHPGEAPTGQPAGGQAVQPGEAPTGQPAGGQAVQPGEAPTGQLASGQAVQPGEAPTGQPASGRAVQPTEEQGEQATESQSTGQKRSLPSRFLLKPEKYELEAEVPIVSEKAIMQAGSTYPIDIKQRYLQLPGELPDRVKELAQDVTKNANTPYEKVRAIENYLRTGGDYKYETKDVPVPAPGQDFVDHFLFDSRRGYCDHFSTSMAVMLRSIGIPARWVKGFAPGSRVGTDSNGNDVIEVRNKDAHSWVEVYFPGQGWIPFEATSTFLSPVRIKYDLNSSEQSVTLPVPNLQENTAAERRNNRLDELEGADSPTQASWKMPWQAKAAALVLLAAGAYLAWRKKRVITYWWLQRQMRSHPNEHYSDRYKLLLQMIQHLHSRREPGETLREYVKRIALTGDKRQDLQYLTHLYERLYYGCREMEEKARSIAQQLIDRLTQQLKP
ncbi:transglutaminase domain-containing protein [Brevibacillus sp. FSL L8-0520]|uniref:transglutaminaseTgpA domain-containing protein n=1 Tax=Brevibacillus sp. FSL L8-0520 TaxID=2954689 RepID=UPI0030CBD5AF